MISKNGKIKIIHAFGVLNRAGAEQRTLDLIKHIDKNKYLCDIISVSEIKGDLEDDFIKLGCKLFHLKKNSSFNKNLREILRRGEYDVFHSHVHYLSGYLLKIAEQEGIGKRITHFRGPIDYRKNTFIRKIIRKIFRYWINKYSTNIIAVSEYTLQKAWRKDWQKDGRCSYIYNGLDITIQKSNRNEICNELHLPTSAKIIIHIGRMQPEKNHLRLLDIFHALAQTRDDVFLLLVGKGDEIIANEINHKIKMLNISNSVRVLGLRSDVMDLLNNSDLLLFPSISEGLPGVVLEACAVGTPVLASNIDSISEIAQYFNSVTTKSLSMTNEEWAKTASDLLTIKNSSGHTNYLSEFENSPFSISNYVTNICNLWNTK